MLGRLRPRFDKFVLLDFPNHANIGDSAIWVGEMAYFDRIGRLPSYTSDLKDIDWKVLDAHVSDGASIVIHGGGNFGDLWEQHQAFREQVLTRYVGHPVIQLPQTIYFSDRQRWREMQQLVRRHGRLIVLARSRESFVRARQLDCESLLCPDMAFCMGELRPPVAATLETVLLLRTDKESGKIRPQDVSIRSDRSLVADWLHEPRSFTWRNRLLSLLRRAAKRSDRGREARYAALAIARVERGLRLLSSGRAVITNRLHGHILSLLLGRPHCVLDNSYGKVVDFAETWGTLGARARRCGTVPEALDEVQALLAGR